MNRRIRTIGPWAAQLCLVITLGAAIWHTTDTPTSADLGFKAAAALREAVAAHPEVSPTPVRQVEKLTWQRNLRQAAATKEVAPARPPAPVPFEFAGAVIDGNSSKVFLKDRGGNVHMKAVGAQVDGWEVVEIHESSVVVKEGDRREVLRMPVRP